MKTSTSIGPLLGKEPVDAQERPAWALRRSTHPSVTSDRQQSTVNGQPRQQLPIAILISGRGSNMRVIAERARAAELPIEIRVVISDKPDAGGLAIARSMGIPTEVVSAKDFADRASYDAVLASTVARYQPKLIVLAGFMRILTTQFIGPFAGRILNVHPSLLPKYRGLHTHRRALEAGDAVHGVSIHFVTEELDGGPVIIQACVDVRPDDTEITLSARVQSQEHSIYPQVIEWFATGRLALSDERVMLDGKALDRPILVEATAP